MYSIKTEKTARYDVIGNLKTAKHIMYVLHGYGQLPQFFIRKFNPIYNKELALVAPEGLHRFYLNGSSGRVGASWMTKEARDQDIADNMAFLNSLHQAVVHQNEHAKFSLLGFSQGGATAARWLQFGKAKIEHFILWASVFPPDLEGLTEQSRFNATSNTFLVGKEDPFFNEQQRIEIKKHLEQLNLNFEYIEFDGEHNIYPEPLSLLKQKIIV